MLTTFERLAKVVKKETAPANWIESAFADLVSAIGSVLPSVSNSDRGKFLGVNTSNNNLGWKTIRQVPDVETADKGKYLHANGDTGALEWSEAGGLPSVTSADEGKVLTVNSSGEWDAETASGGGVEYFDVTISSTDGSAYTADKTWEEISAALEAKKIIVVNNSYTYHKNILIIPLSDGSALQGTQASIYAGTIEVEVIEIGYSDRTQTMYITVTTASVTANN